MRENKGATTVIATGTIISMICTGFIGVVCFGAKQYIDKIQTVEASVVKIQTVDIPAINSSIVVNQTAVGKDITYIKEQQEKMNVKLDKLLNKF